MLLIRRAAVTLICITLIASVVAQTSLTKANKTAAGEGAPVPDEPPASLESTEHEPYYLEVSERWKQEGVPAATSNIVIEGSRLAGLSEQADVITGHYAGRNNVLIWRNDRTNWIEYEVHVPETGLYEIVLTYHSYNDKESPYRSFRPTMLAMSVDGRYLFREARAMAFPRLFRDTLPFKKDEFGDHIRPRPIELEQWIEKPFEDAGGAYSAPLQWKLTEGTHRLRLQSFSPIVIGQIELRSPAAVPAYADITPENPDNSPAGSEIVIVETETVHAKNDVALQVTADHDAFTTPDANNKTIFNAVGGTRWQSGGGAVTWSFEVAESGRYKIGMRAYQGYQSNKKVFRKIYIDGKVPFRELLAYPIPYSSGWQGVLLEDESGNPYEIYLEKGMHTITMQTTYAPFNPVIKEQEGVLRAIRALSDDINTITAGVDDRNRTWSIEENFPELIDQLESILTQVKEMETMLIEVNGQADNNTQALSTSVTDLQEIKKYPNDIPYKLEELSTVATRIGSITAGLTNAPLMLDKLYIAPVGAKMPRIVANWWEKLAGSFSAFIHSFGAESRLSYDNDEVLNVWINYGRDYVNLIQDMADQYFTPETGIRVKADLLPDENLLVLANAAGKAPDIALGMTEGRPIELAIRGAVENLADNPGFEDVFKQYSPGSTLPYYYNGGYYALPETQRFQVLYYRKDILQKLGLQIPETWEDVIRMIPTLQQNGYNFHVPFNDYMTFIYQHGADFYTGDGLKTALDTPEAFSGFKLMTDLFTIYGIERQVPSFYQHFRDGDMPIGIADFNFYLQMRVAAPELDGWWGIAPMPGTRGPDGEIERWTGGNQTSAAIFSKSVNKEEAWKFLQWWLSADVQQRFGNDLEGFYGVAFRWNTANLEAFTRLPWNEDELNVMLEQWRWYKDIANIPGSYFISRELLNAWNRTVLSGQNYRDSLEEAVLGINREIWRKAKEFGFIDETGNIVDTYDPPKVKEPWKGVDAYVSP
ncbi:extracellular solute-binding protein [Paenibacillus alkalitolerans]|uniref:extracellular solute-binding protein n=1 Tax=Paenibacillus alkalitolerans TaxID=2799335 RepID=UPI0018F33B6D|nr:extracellular solute-binding protein [Paenibacillus alkalitolerans]